MSITLPVSLQTAMCGTVQLSCGVCLLLGMGANSAMSRLTPMHAPEAFTSEVSHAKLSRSVAVAVSRHILLTLIYTGDAKGLQACATADTDLHKCGRFQQSGAAIQTQIGGQFLEGHPQEGPQIYSNSHVFTA